MDDVNEGQLLSERQVAQRWGISLAALRRWRTKRTGPRFLKLGKLVRYKVHDLDSWLARQAVKTQ